MSEPQLRFLHASDFHLGVPVGGVADVPDAWRDKFIDAPYLAARRVFDTALAEKVDFVLLSGGLLHPRRGGPRGVAFLVEQFERLAEHGIDAYWAGGPEDRPEQWPSAVRLPANMIRFPTSAAARHLARANQQPCAIVVGRSCAARRKLDAADFLADRSAPVAIAVAHGVAEPRKLAASGFHYWALGGRAKRATAGGATHRLHYPGSPQGRTPGDTGPRGCTVVRIDREGRSHLDFVATDVLRWRSERVAIDALNSRVELEHLIRERVALAASEVGPIDLLISWTLAGRAASWTKLQREFRVGELLDWMRREFAAGLHLRWSASLETETSDLAVDDSTAEDTILGEFLREVHRHGEDESLPLDLGAYIGPRHADSPLATLAQTIPVNDRRRLIGEAAALGIELLAGEEVQP